MSPPRRALRQWWARRTIRFRLALWYGVGGTLLVALFAATLYGYVAVRLARPLDYQLRQDLAVVEANLTLTPDFQLRWKGEPIAEPAPWLNAHPWFEVWDDKGKLIRRIWPFEGNRSFRFPDSPSRTVSSGSVSVFYVAPDLRLRTLLVHLKVEGAASFWMLRMMRVHQPHADALPDLLLIIVLALPVVVSLLVLGGHYFTRRWLLPMDQMAAEANRISIDDLKRRLPVDNPHDELGRLARVFNVTLDRLQNSFEALDRFVTDASHELRTPLTTLRSVGEVGLRRSRSEEEYRGIIGSMLEEAQRLQQLVERLLQLASAEGASQALHRERIAIRDLVGTCAQELGILAEQRRQRIVIDGPACTAATDRVILRQALQNLIDNAIKYAPEDSEIRLRVRDSDDRVEIDVLDQGPGISPADRPNLMERFFRPDRARRRESGGFGLGLAITKAYVRTLGGSLHYEPVQPRGSLFRLAIPKQ